MVWQQVPATRQEVPGDQCKVAHGTPQLRTLQRNPPSDHRRATCRQCSDTSQEDQSQRYSSQTLPGIAMPEATYQTAAKQCRPRLHIPQCASNPCTWTTACLMAQ